MYSLVQSNLDVDRFNDSAWLSIGSTTLQGCVRHPVSRFLQHLARITTRRFSKSLQEQYYVGDCIASLTYPSLLQKSDLSESRGAATRNRDQEGVRKGGDEGDTFRHAGGRGIDE